MLPNCLYTSDPVNRCRAGRPISQIFARALAAGGIVLAGAIGAAPAAMAADLPVRTLLAHKLDPAPPAGANAVRFALLGDKSGARVQIRLLAPGQDGVLTGYYAAPETVVDWAGWKTITLPLSSFSFRSDVQPGSEQDGLSSRESLPNASHIQIAVTSADARVFVDDLVWTTEGSAETDAPLAVIDDFNATGPLTTYQPAGDFEQLKALRFNRNRTAQFVQGGTGGALEIVVRVPSVTERQSYRTATEAVLKKAPSPGYAVFSRSLFETITPDTVPAPVEAQNPAAVSLFACMEEIEPATFSVYTVKNLKNATVKLAGPLKGPGGRTIPASAVDIRVVRIAPVESGPQLLMKDDRQSLAGPLPSVRLTGDPVTDIPARTTKQFWITVRMPRLNLTPAQLRQAAGAYVGKLVFSATGAKPTGIAFTVEMLPLTLRTPFLQYGMDFRSHLTEVEANLGEPTVTPEVYSTQLANIRDHGFRLLAVHDRPGAGLEKAVELYRQSGMSATGPVIVAAPLSSPGDVAAVEALRTAGGPPLDLYYRLPLLGTGSEGAEAARSYAANIYGANPKARVVASVEAKSAYGAYTAALNDALGERLAPIYSLSSDYCQKILQSGSRDTPNRDYWSWDIASQSPLRNRLFAGMLLYKTGPSLYGAFPGPYQLLPPGGDPYGVFDPARAADPALARGRIVAYPVQGGVLDTLQWEAVREGIDDIRYIGILKGYTREMKDAKIHKDVTEAAEAFVYNAAAQPLLTQDAGVAQRNRRGIVDQSIKLMKLLPKTR